MNIANKIVVKMGQSEKMLQKIKSDHVSVIHEVLLKSHQETKDLTFICGDGQIVEVSRTVVCLFSPFITELLQEIPSYLNKVISLPDLSSSDMKQIIEILNFFLSSKRTDQKNISKKLVDVANNLLGLNLIYEVIIDVNSHVNVDSENGANEINKNGGHDSNFEKKKTLQIKPLSGLSMNSENICEQPTVEKEINSSKTDTTQQNVANTIIKQSTVDNHSSIAQSQVINVDEISDIPRSMSPVTRSLTPMQRSMTPMQRFMTPVQRSMNPMQRSMNPMQRSMTPMQRSMTPMQRSMTPMQRSMTPMLNSMSPMPRSLTPGQDWTRPMTPMPRLIAPMPRPMTPMLRSMTPIPRPTSPLLTPASFTSGPITSMVQPITSMVQPVASMVGPMASIVGPMTSPVIPMTSMVGPMTTKAPIYTNGAMHVQRAIASPSGQLNAIPGPMNPMLRPTGSMIGPNSLQLPMNPMMMKNMPRPMHILPNSMNPPKLFNHVNNLPRPVIATNLLTRPMNPPMPIQSPVNLMNNIHRPSTESQAINGDLDILSIENEGEVDILPNQANEFNLLPKSGNEAPVNPDNETLLYKATNEAGFSKILNFSFKGFEENKLVETLGKIIKYQIPNSLNSRIRIDILKHSFGNKTDNSKKSLENKSFILIPDRRKHKFQVTSVNTSDAPDVIKRSESLSNVPTSGLSTFSNSTKFPLQKNPDDEKLDNQKKTNDDANKKLQGALCENSTTADLDSSEDGSVSRTAPIENNEYDESKMETNSYEDGQINKVDNPEIDDDTPDSIDTGEKYKSSKNDISDRGNHIGEKSKSISNDVFSEDISRKNYSEGSITRKRKISENTTTTNKKTNVNPVDDGFAICFFLPLGWMYKQSKGEYRAPNGTLFNTIKDVYKSLDESNAKERTNDNTKCDEKSLERDSQLIKIKKDSKDNITAGENKESNGHYKNMDDLLDSDSEPEDDYISSTIELEEDATVLKNNKNESQLESNTDVTKNFTDVSLITKEPVQEVQANTEPQPDVENREAQLDIERTGGGKQQMAVESGEQQIDSDSDKQYPDVDSDDQQLDTDNLEHLDNDDDEQQLNMESDEQQLDEDTDEEQLETESEEDRRLNGTDEQLFDSDSDDEDVEFADDDQLDIDSNETQVDIDDDRESLDISGNGKEFDGDGKTLNIDSNDQQPDISMESNEQQLDIEGEDQQMNNERDETQLDIENDFSDSESDNDDEQPENDNEFSESDTEIGQNDSTEDKNNTDVRNEVGSNEKSNPESDDARLDIDNDNDDFSDSEDDEEDGLTDHERSETIEENNDNITDDEEDDFSDSEPSETIEENNEIDENMMEIKSIKQSIMDLLKSN